MQGAHFLCTVQFAALHGGTGTYVYQQESQSDNFFHTLLKLDQILKLEGHSFMTLTSFAPSHNELWCSGLKYSSPAFDVSYRS